MVQDQLGLYDTPPDRRETRLAIAVGGMLFAAALLILPVHYIQLREIDAFVPMVDAFMFLAELIIAIKLYAQAFRCLVAEIHKITSPNKNDFGKRWERSVAKGSRFC